MALAASMDQMGDVPALCPRCGKRVTLQSGRPLIDPVGRSESAPLHFGAGPSESSPLHFRSPTIELWHEQCWDVHNESVEITILDVLPFAPTREWRIPRRAPAPVIGVIAVGIACWLSNAPLATPPTIDLAARESIALRVAAIAHEVAPAALDPLVVHPIPKFHGQPVPEIYPTLTSWVHPVIKTTRVLPELPTGGFGAERAGVQRHECGRGHCGDDISGPIGRPIVAVADGVVIHVDRSRLGKDKRSGRYVRLEHEDGTVTAYMHLNSITAGLDRGDRVFAGQQIGTLGATAVYSAPPHLHFALELPNIPGQHGDGKNTHYVDPAPFLVRAQVLDAPDRRRAQKPAM